MSAIKNRKVWEFIFTHGLTIGTIFLLIAFERNTAYNLYDRTWHFSSMPYAEHKLRFFIAHYVALLFGTVSILSFIYIRLVSMGYDVSQKNIKEKDAPTDGGSYDVIKMKNNTMRAKNK